MALDFPNAPTNGQVYTVTSTGEQWIYEAATNSWTSKGLVNTTGGLQYKGDINITATPPTGATSGSQYSVNPSGTANAGFGPGVTGNVAKGSMVMYTGTGWIETSHAVPDATPAVKGIDTRKWTRTGTALSPATAGDVVNFSAATAARPGLTPVGDPDSGLFSPGPNEIAIATSGAGRLFVAASGDVGVGIATPTSALDVNGDVTILDKLIHGGDAGAAIGFPATGTVSIQTSGAERCRVAGNGKVLIGTTVPAIVSSSLSPLLTVRTTGNPAAFISDRADNSGPILSLAKSRSATIGGNTIVQNNDILGEIKFAGADGVNLAINGAEISAEVDGTPSALRIPGRLVFSTTGPGKSVPEERLRITSDAVLVGTTTFMSAPTTTNAGCQLSAYGLNASRSDQPCLQLQRTGSDGPIAAFYRHNTLVGSISVTTTATTYGTSSDYRLKENVTPVTDGITRLQQLKPSRFNFIAEPGKTVDGFIAHEAQTVVPECVTGTKDAVDGDGKPEYQGIDQSKLVPLLTAALQEAIGEIESLKARVAALETP